MATDMIKMALRTTCIENVKLNIIKIRTSCQYVGSFHYSENLNWAAQNLWLACMWPSSHRLDIDVLECITEPCMIEIVEYIPKMANHWQVNVNNSHCSRGRIHWHSKCINPCTCSPLIHSKMISKASNFNTKSNTVVIKFPASFYLILQKIINLLFKMHHTDFTRAAI